MADHATMMAEYPDGWKLADDACMQYVRRVGPLAYELIEYGMVSQDGPLYEVYTDTIHLGDYAQAEIEDILRGFGYAGIEDVYEKYPVRDEANQVISESIFEHFGSFAAEQLCCGVSESFVHKAILDHILLRRELPETHWMVSLSPDEDGLCPEARKMRDRDEDKLLSQSELLSRLAEGENTDATLVEIREDLKESLGFDPAWRFPFCHDAGLGAMLIPVKEGFLWLPYDIIVAGDNEIYKPDKAALLTAESAGELLESITQYVKPMVAVLRYVVEELKATEQHLTIRPDGFEKAEA